MEEDYEIMPNLLDRRRLKDRIIENISKAVKNVRSPLTFDVLLYKKLTLAHCIALTLTSPNPKRRLCLLFSW